jgi:hypothetical protein
MSENKITVSRTELPLLYHEVVVQNPLLARMEATCGVAGWTTEEIRTFQLLVACKSNASLTARLKELESRLATIAIP